MLGAHQYHACIGQENPGPKPQPINSGVHKGWKVALAISLTRPCSRDILAEVMVANVLYSRRDDRTRLAGQNEVLLVHIMWSKSHQINVSAFFCMRTPRMMWTGSSTSTFSRGVRGLTCDTECPRHQRVCSAVRGLEATASCLNAGQKNCLEWKLCPSYCREDSRKFSVLLTSLGGQ